MNCTPPGFDEDRYFCGTDSDDNSLSREDVTTVLSQLRDELVKEQDYDAVGRLQSAMHQLGITY